MALLYSLGELLIVAFRAGGRPHMPGEEAVEAGEDCVIFAAGHVNGTGIGGGFENPHDLGDGVVQLVGDGTQGTPGGAVFFGEGLFEGCEGGAHTICGCRYGGGAVEGRPEFLKCLVGEESMAA